MDHRQKYKTHRQYREKVCDLGVGNSFLIGPKQPQNIKVKLDKNGCHRKEQHLYFKRGVKEMNRRATA